MKFNVEICDVSQILFFTYGTEQQMSGVQLYYFADESVVIDEFSIRNEYSLSEFDIESDNLGHHLDHPYRCLVYPSYDTPQLPVKSLNNLMTCELSPP